MTAKVLEGAQLLHVGERPHGDKKYATDEYVLAPPGTIVAPRLKNEKPTPENAARAIIRMGNKLGMIPGGRMGNLPAFNAYRKMQGIAGPSVGGRRRSAQGRAESRPLAGAAWGGGVVGSGPQAFSGLNAQTAGMGGAPQFPAPAPAPAPAAPAPVDTAATGEALRAIQGVAGQNNVDIPTAVSMLQGRPASQGPVGAVGFAEGTGAFGSLLSNLIQGAGITGPDLMLAQLGIMQSLGLIDPRAIGVTDPSKFRSILGEGMGMPTLDMKKQLFNESLFGFQQAAPRRGGVPITASS